MQGVKNVTKNQPVDNVQEDEGRGEEDPGHAIDADCTLPPFLHDLLAVLHGPGLVLRQGRDRGGVSLALAPEPPWPPLRGHLGVEAEHVTELRDLAHPALQHRAPAVSGAGGGIAEHLSLRLGLRLEFLAPGIEVTVMMSTILVCQRSFMIGIHLVLFRAAQVYRVLEKFMMVHQVLHVRSPVFPLDFTDVPHHHVDKGVLNQT